MNDAHNAVGVGNSCAVDGLGNSPAHTQPAPQEFVPDHLAETLLETAIEVARQRLCEAPTRDEKLDAWREMCGLMDQRTSPPSTSVRQAKASAECRGNAAGGAP